MIKIFSSDIKILVGNNDVSCVDGMSIGRPILAAELNQAGIQTGMITELLSLMFDSILDSVWVETVSV